MFNNSFKSEYANKIVGVIFFIFFLVALKDRRYFPRFWMTDGSISFISGKMKATCLPSRLWRGASLPRLLMEGTRKEIALFCHNKSRGQLRRRGYLRGASQEMTFVLCEEYA